MSSTRETFGLVAFASRVPAVFVRKEMKAYLLKSVDPKGERREAEDEFVAALAALRRKPDSVAVLDEEKSALIGLPPTKHLLFVEVEYSSAITERALQEYADLYDMAQDEDHDFSVALAIVDHYGSHRFVDLGGIVTACAFLRGGGLGDSPAFDAFKVRTSIG